jgi:hypothetical protein
LRLERRLRETGQLAPLPSVNAGRNRNVRTPENEYHVLEEVHESPQASVRKISRRTGLPRLTVHSVLKDQGLHLFHYTRVQSLTPHDHRHRVRFCEWILERRNDEPDFATFVLWSDEATFSREGVDQNFK